MTIENDVSGLLANPRINFCHIDRLIVCKFDADVLSKVNNFFLWLEEERNIGKEIIRNETGRIRLPKTPKRGYCFSQEAETFQKCRKKLLDSVKLKRAYVFANDENIATHIAQTPKSSKNTTARAVKQDAMLANGMNNRKTPIRPVSVPRQYISKQQTPIKMNKYPPTSGNNTPKRTPHRTIMTSKITAQKIVADSEATVRKATVAPKAAIESTVTTPKMKIAVTPKAVVQQPTFKRSEVIRKMEKRTNTVIKNKEEFMKEKAERARRDREERALRVKMNNKKKEEEALEKLRIIKMREQQIAELRQKQCMPQRAISKSPCRTRGYYNRIQKPIIRAKSSQDISMPRNVLQREITKNREENLQFHGKRNHIDSIKQDVDAQNKKQKLEFVECKEREDINGHSTKTDTPEKVLNEEFDNQTHTECPENNDTGNSEGRGSLQNITHMANEQEEAPAVSEQEMLGSLRNCDVSLDIVVSSSVVKSSVINEKENMDNTSQVMEVDTSIAETNNISNQTFDKSVDVLSNETLDDIGNNYDVESISSNDETDDEENPRKPIPFWAQGERLQNALRKQVMQPSIDPDAYFGPVRTPMLDKIFARNRTRYNKRTSSALWTSPMSNPKKGTNFLPDDLLHDMMTKQLSVPEDQIKDSELLVDLKQFRKEWFQYCCAAVFTIKFLVIPCYHSTDFEVHRNWMAITHALPICSWYYDATSQWMLDYPPFFAFFEYFLSQIASKIIPSALVLQKEAYFSIELLYFQRFSVIATDVFYILSCIFLTRTQCKNNISIEKNSLAIDIFLITNVSLVMIDNMHFQYNGMLTSFLLVSLGCIMRKYFLCGALIYCILLNMKHIYLYYAPAYVMYYAVNYLFPSKKAFIVNSAKLIAVLILPFALSFGPFIYLCGPDVLQQIWRRLFPFERGLTHAYWAPNLWAFYNFADWYIYQVLKYIKRLPPNVQSPTYVSGLVQEFKHSILPSVSPFATLLVTLALLLPTVLLVRTRHSKNFPLLLTLSAFAFFFGGYHVHEKAVILITIPYTILASSDHRFLPSFIVLSVVANVSLFPLFFTPFENMLKVSITLCYLFLSISIIQFLCPERSLRFLQKLYLCGLLIVQVYCLVFHQIIFDTNFGFIPLMLTSLSTAFGIFWIYLELLWNISFENPKYAKTSCICKKKLKTK